ncbi:MAG: DUF971 domain-containing protein [Proteobacteria bacterium]|nr:DUF971 domain-containing protein [Pseudomonadota bacterium]
MAFKRRAIPKDIFFDGEMNIIWKDGAHTTYDYWQLRTSCPCASCVDEITGEKILDDATVPKDVHPVRSAYIGNYALEILWSDDHNTGIYTFDKLRDIYPHEVKSVN